ncbi:MAG: SoxR reducing system RseC family protein [Halarsenatibacteraceae bacterium]
MEEEAVVVKSLDGRAEVRLIKQSACQHCEHDCGLAGDSHEIKELNVEVENPIDAKPGQKVVLEMGNKEVYFASILVYLLPLIFMFAGYFIFGAYLPQLIEIGNEPAGMIGALGLLIASFFSLRKVDDFLRKKKSFHPKITKILNN